ncbi:unnamed protein product [Rotaria magnacalcarata]|uniref:Beta-hexosaminidase n=2 Tax=Rotaria magnacalcarata TaxID=392030 RepID=A0A819YWI7_9BILA|nr:unnamed protein product [Rotaria magnacalcarata]
MLHRSLLLLYLAVITSSEILFLAVDLPLKGKRSPPNAIWPHPQEIQISNDLLYIRPGHIMISSNMEPCDIIAKAIPRYQPVFFPPKLTMHQPPADTSNILRSLTLNVLDNPQCEQYIQYNSNETCNPRFQHRGVLLDSSRHFLPVPLIKKNLDVMAYNKLNVFHWHIVDDQSFPFESRTFPNLSRQGAFSSDHVCTPEDVTSIIEHARLLGIRVIPEIDTPGHTYSWGKSMPELITVCWANGKPYQAIYGQHGEMEIFNPIEPRVYSTMDALLREVKSIFPSNYIHLGNIESIVSNFVRRSNPNISRWMTDNKINSTRDLHSYYANRILDIMRNISAIPIVWQDIWDEKVELPPGTIVQIWKGTSDDGISDEWVPYLNEIAGQGYNVILSSPWYINYINNGHYRTNTTIVNLEFFKYYEVEPLRDFSGSDDAKIRILGGEACLWGEFVDGTNLLARLWPKTAAVAERLWSAASVNNSEDAQFRLDVHRCRLLRRGIPAQPILNGYCGNYELSMPNAMINDPAFNYDISPATDLITTTIKSNSATSYLFDATSSMITSIFASLLLLMNITLATISFKY